MATKKLVKQAIANLESRIEVMQPSTNPQIVVEVVKMKAQVDILKCVLESLNGDNVGLRLYT